jgi:hypothetical protein
MSAPRPTPHQREVLARLTRYSQRMDWVPEHHVGSHGALWHLIDKGLVEARPVIGPRGGTTYEYRPVKDQV